MGRAISGSAILLRDLIQDGSSLLLIGPPGSGKNHNYQVSNFFLFYTYIIFLKVQEILKKEILMDLYFWLTEIEFLINVTSDNLNWG